MSNLKPINYNAKLPKCDIALYSEPKVFWGGHTIL